MMVLTWQDIQKYFSKKFSYSPFDKTLPRSILKMHLISVRFYEMGDIPHILRHNTFLIKKRFSFILLFFRTFWVCFYFLKLYIYPQSFHSLTHSLICPHNALLSQLACPWVPGYVWKKLVLGLDLVTGTWLKGSASATFRGLCAPGSCAVQQ